jgi:hypothetical protein
VRACDPFLHACCESVGVCTVVICDICSAVVSSLRRAECSETNQQYPNAQNHLCNSQKPFGAPGQRADPLGAHTTPPVAKHCSFVRSQQPLHQALAQDANAKTT